MQPFSEDELTRLVAGDVLEHLAPLGFLENKSIEKIHHKAARTVENTLRVRSRIEWNHYGSGYASFVDAWFYFADGRARSPLNEESHFGVVVLFSRVSRYYVLGQGEKFWHKTGEGSYLPDLKMVDSVTHAALKPLEQGIDRILPTFGLERVVKADLEPPISSDIEIPTILSDPPYHVFDVLFHWED